MSGPNSYSKTYSYDASYGHNTSVSETIAGTAYVTDMTYDSKGRLDKLKYPGPSNRLEIQHLYNVRGYLTTVKNAATSLNYYTATAMDARGNVTAETHGNGLTTSRVYQANTGYLQSVSTGNNPLNNRQNLSFTFDKLGNLISRDDAVKNMAEVFDYDSLNRLSQSHVDIGNGQPQTVAITYDALGNIKTKTGVGTYSYGNQCGAGSRFNAVCNITAGSVGTKTASYSYDANGNLTSGDGRTVTWSAFDKPLSISQSGASSTMTYGAERNLITKSETTAGNTTSTVYSGGYEKVTLPGNITEERHNIAGNTIVTYTNRTASSAGTLKTRYLHKDHLGSVTVITNESGAEVEAFSFDPWGKRRAMSLAQLQSILGNWSTLNTYQKGNLTIGAQTLTSAITDKGFTGHRQLDNVGLIHMGGRVYDAEIGRFLSADPFVQDSTNLQALNRYSYVQNNPLSYTDPSGYFLKGLIKKWGKALKSAVSAVIEFERELRRKILRSLGKIEGLSTVISIGLTMMGCPYCAVAFNAAMTDANGGTIGQVLTGVAIGFIASGIPGNESGSFWDGGLGARIASGLGGGAPGNIGASLFIGGSIAKAQGGKFIDGVKGAAVTMGIAYGVSRIMNSVSEPADVQDSKNSGGMPNRAGAEKAVNEMYENGELSTDMTFDTRDEAAKYFGDKLYSVTAANNIELGAQLIHKGGVWTIGEIQFGALNAEGTHYVSVRGPYGIHTHPPGSQEFPSNHDASQVQYKDEPLRPYKGLYTVGSTGITYCGSRCGRLGSSAYERVK